MRAVDIIIKKRDKQDLTREEIQYFINGLTSGEIPDYQITAWAMAVLLNGMTVRETTYLTLAMAQSGEMLDLSQLAPIVVDKHSTGGVGDKTSLVVAPVVAACGLPVGKMSGRGLGYSGGTLDKLESIPGFRVDLSREEFLNHLSEHGIVLSGQSVDLAPADGKLYALRDVTGTVPSIPLIASSIMSKKIASGAHAIVLDVKVGLGAFMKDLDDARALAHTMVEIGRLCHSAVRAILSDMNQPLGFAVGNSLEVKEAIDTLHGSGPEDFYEHCILIAGHMLVLGGKAESLEQTRGLVTRKIQSGEAFQKFRELVSAQDGDVSFVDHPEKLPAAKIVRLIAADRNGYLKQIHAQLVGETAVSLGAGRTNKGDPIDLSVGLLVHQKVGNAIKPGDPLFTIHANDAGKADEAETRLKQCLTWSDEPCPKLPLFYDVVM
jgi:pyrimidine-nucleoside phosphorylase